MSVFLCIFELAVYLHLAHCPVFETLCQTAATVFVVKTALSVIR